MIDLDITIETLVQELELELESAGGELELELESPGYIPPMYEGPYMVTPDFTSQVLETAEKMMSDDVIVDEIPVAEVTNPAGGLTLTVGS